VDFGIGRGFGSGFYALSSLVIGNLSDSISPEIIPIFAAVSTVLLTIAVIFYRLPDTDHGKPRQRMARKTDNGQMSFVEFTKHYKVFMIFLIGIMLVYLDHMFINNFFYQIITPIGGTSVEMGYAISLAAVLEVPIMFLFHKIAKKCKCTTILKFSMIMYVIKHALTWFAMNMTMIYIAQALQMLAYALMCPALVYYVNEIIDQKDLVKGQSMSNVSMTAAGIIADVLGGVMIDSVGVHTALFITLVLTIIGAAIIFATADKTKVIQR
jgi:PPP family 3-phenylpropionic acid transporter